MRVKVNLISLFAKYAKADDDGLTTITDGALVLDLAESLDLPMKRLKIITVNGKQCDLNQPLADGDEIFFFPPAIGGG